MRASGKSLSTFDTMVMVVGLVLGVGIFRAPQLVAAHTGQPSVFIAMWVAGGVFSLIGALCYAELASAYPDSGGEYHFVSRALGSSVGFLFAWARMTVLQTGSIALLAYVFADYAATLAGVPRGGTPLLAAAVVAALTLVNVRGLRPGRLTQYVLTVVEVLGLMAVVVAGLWVMSSTGVQRSSAAPSATPSLGLAFVFVLLTFGGWSEAAYLSGEVRDKRRGVTAGLLLGIAVITTLYVLVNAVYLGTLGIAGVAASTTVAADVSGLALGKAGGALVSVFVMVAALSSANAAMITGARSNYALGRNFRWLGWMGNWDARRGTPANALLAQGAVALALVAFGAIARSGFEAMVAYTAPVFWLVLFWSGVSIFVLRRREPHHLRPFRVPLYPLTPAIFCAGCVYMTYASVRYAGLGALLGLAVMAAAVPIYVLGNRRAGGAVLKLRS